MLIPAAHSIWLLLATLYAFLALGSCSATVPATVYAVQTELPLPRPEYERRLTILSARGQDTQELFRAANLFMIEHPDILISVHTIGDENDYSAALRTRLLAGERVDLFHIFGHADMIELAPHLDDLSDLYWAGGAIANTLEPVTAGDELLGLPFSIEGLGLLVNPNIFAYAGVSLAGTGEDFDTLEDAWRELRELITLGNVLNLSFPDLRSVTALPGLDDEFISRQLSDIALSGAFISPQSAATASSIGSANLTGAGLYISLLARYTTHGGSWDMLMDISQLDQLEALASQRVAAIQQSTEVFGTLTALNPETAEDFRLMPIPISGGGEGAVYVHSPVYWAVNAGAEDDSRALAREFLSWLYRSELGAALIAVEMGILSPFRDTAAPTDNPMHTQLLEYISTGQILPRRYRDFPAGWASLSFATALREHFTIFEVNWPVVSGRIAEDWMGARANYPIHAIG